MVRLNPPTLGSNYWIFFAKFALKDALVLENVIIWDDIFNKKKMKIGIISKFNRDFSEVFQLKKQSNIRSKSNHIKNQNTKVLHEGIVSYIF